MTKKYYLMHSLQMMNGVLVVSMHPLTTRKEQYAGDMIGEVPMILRLKNFLEGRGRWFVFIGYRHLNDIKKSKWEFQRNGGMITVTEIYGNFRSDDYFIDKCVAKNMVGSLHVALMKCKSDSRNTTCVVDGIHENPVRGVGRN